MLLASHHSARTIGRPWRGAPPPLRVRGRSSLRVSAYDARPAASFEELKGAAGAAHSQAAEALPRLQAARAAALQAKQPAEEAERRWQEAHAKLAVLGQEAGGRLEGVRGAVREAAGGGQAVTQGLLRDHLAHRLAAYRQQLPSVAFWQEFPQEELPLCSIPGGGVLAQLAACEAADGSKYAVAAIAASGPALADSLRSLLLHWGCAEGVHAQWALQLPTGWKTSPGVSQPSGDRAWQTIFAAYAPQLESEALTSAAVHSVVLQVPLEGVFELRGGIKFVLHRTDGGQPEWVKAGHHNNGDFWVDFLPAITLFEERRRAAQAAAIARTQGAAAELAAEIKAWAVPTASGDWDEHSAAQEGEAAEASGAGEPSSSSGDAGSEAAAQLPAPPAWVSKLQGWVALPDYPPQSINLSQQLLHLECVAAAVAASAGQPGAAAASSSGSAVQEGSAAAAAGEGEPAPAAGPGAAAAAAGEAARQLLAQCRELGGVLSQQDALELASRAAQQEKESLQATYQGATDEAGRLQNEVTQALELARRAVVNLRGRETEVTQRDMELLSLQMAEGMVRPPRGARSPLSLLPFGKADPEERQLVFVQQKVMQVAGVEAAGVLVQVFLEGSKAAVEAATAPITPAAGSSGGEAASAGDKSPDVDAAMVASTLATSGQDSSATGSLLAAAAGAVERAVAAGTGGGSAAAAAAAPPPPPPRPTFESAIVSITMAEEFPDGRLSSQPVVHWGCVAHQFARWQAAPDSWSSAPVCLGTEGTAAQVPFQRYSIRREDGDSVFVDPSLWGLTLRLPLDACVGQGIRGIEFVVKTADSRWLTWQHSGQGTNFYAELPLPML